jgi:hypothetical protein
LSLLVTFSVSGADLDASPYLPEHPGDEWTMDLVLTAPNGDTGHAILHRKIDAPVERDGKSYVTSRTWIENAPESLGYTKLVRKDATGLHSFWPNDQNPKEQLEVPFPLHPGATWRYQAQGKEMDGQIIAIETVKIGEKTYDSCIHIRQTCTDGSGVEDFWEAPNVGCVKSETSYNNGIKTTATLREFKSRQ